MTRTSAPQWFIRRSIFPFANPGAALGIVEASDRREAEARGVEMFGAPIVVEPVLARDLVALERAVAAAERRRSRSHARSPHHARRAEVGRADVEGDELQGDAFR